MLQHDAQNGEFALFIAAKHGHVECVRLLLEDGAGAGGSVADGAANARTGACSRGDARLTPLMACARARGEGEVWDEIARLLLAHRADADAIDSSGTSVLMHVASSGNEACARLLLEHGADATKTGPAGSTALLMAIMRGHLGIVQLLAAYGARDERGGFEEAEGVARERGHLPVADWLAEARTWPVDSSLHHVESMPRERAEASLRSGADLHTTGGSASVPTPLELAQRLHREGKAPPGSSAYLVLMAARPWSAATHVLLWPAAHQRWAVAVAARHALSVEGAARRARPRRGLGARDRATRSRGRRCRAR